MPVTRRTGPVSLSRRARLRAPIRIPADRKFKGPFYGQGFARGLAALGDRDGDGGPELAAFVPALASEQPHHGRVAILSLAPQAQGVARGGAFEDEALGLSTGR